MLYEDILSAQWKCSGREVKQTSWSSVSQNQVFQIPAARISNPVAVEMMEARRLCPFDLHRGMSTVHIADVNVAVTSDANAIVQVIATFRHRPTCFRPVF